MEELFQEYHDFPNLNQFDFLVRPNSPIDQDYGVFIRQFRHNPDDQSPSVNIGKFNVGLISEKRKDSEKECEWSVTLTCPQNLIPKAQGLFVDGSSECKYSFIAGRGQIIQMHPHMKNDKLPSYYAMLREIIIDGLGKDMQTVFDVARLTEFSDRTRLDRSIVWIDDLGSGNEMAKELIEDGKQPVFNKVRLAGLVYMPPSINAKGLQFRIRIKRRDDDSVLPKDYRTKDGEGYDFVNVLVQSQKEAERLYLKVKQGHPVYVEGTFEPARFWKSIRPKNMNQVAEYLGIDINSPYIKRIRNFFSYSKHDDGPTMVLPTANVWADEIITDEDTICDKASDGWV